jgi:hypothetical protein
MRSGIVSPFARFVRGWMLRIIRKTIPGSPVSDHFCIIFNSMFNFLLTYKKTLPYVAVAEKLHNSQK